MLTGSSIKLTTIFGIRVGVNVSWFLVLFLFVFWLNQAFEDILGDSQLAFFVAVAAALGFFASILLHEFGHALAARREGIEVSGIDLFFFGGVMKMSSDTRSPGPGVPRRGRRAAGDAPDRDRHRARQRRAARLERLHATPRRSRAPRRRTRSSCGSASSSR